MSRRHATRAEEADIRRDERHRLADLLEGDADAIGGFTTTGAKAVRLVVELLRMPYGESPS